MWRKKLLRHVSNDHIFKNGYFFYRFRQDDAAVRLLSHDLSEFHSHSHSHSHSQSHFLSLSLSITHCLCFCLCLSLWLSLSLRLSVSQSLSLCLSLTYSLALPLSTPPPHLPLSCCVAAGPGIETFLNFCCSHPSSPCYPNAPSSPVTSISRRNLASVLFGIPQCFENEVGVYQ